MTDLKRYSQLVEEKLQQLNLPNQPINLYDPLRYFLTLGGKRMRPILTLLAGQLYGKKEADCIAAALCVELFHNFTLIHDDIMDDAPLRRSKPTVHEKWNTNIAILSGDVLFVKAYQQLSHYPPPILSELLAVFNRTAIEVCEGQQMDMDFETRTNVSVDEYIEMIRLKTSVLLGCALEMGAIVGEADEENRAFLYEFGVQLGIAFQIQDDLLDLYGDPLKVGKQIGGDILMNKKTLLSLTALNLADTQQRQKLITLLDLQDGALKIKETLSIFSELSVKESCQEQMLKYYNGAMVALGNVNSINNTEQLGYLAKYLFHREY